MKKLLRIALVALAMSPVMVQAKDDATAQLDRDRQAVDDALEDHRKAVLEHGATSDDAKTAMDRLDAARNKQQIDIQRAKELEQLDKKNK